ncbi:MAG: type IV conjugative transfer system lipoprotein TraV [Candidatus Paceibacterota bacterium]|jgi:conjugal transfer pilus assembly protein TraV
MRRAFIWAALGLLLSGCSPWNTNYACKGYPETVQCKSAREVYELTNNRDSLEKPKNGQNADCPECGGNLGDPGNPRYLTPAAAASTEAVQGLGYAGPMPLRSAAKIMRVWVAPWESMDGALHLPAYLYAEVVERRWSIGERRMEVAPQITPLLDRTMPESPPQAQRKPAAKGQKKPDLSDLSLPKENPHPAPTLDTSIKKSKNAPQNAFINRKTGQMQRDTLFGTD